MQSLALDVKILAEDDTEMELKERDNYDLASNIEEMVAGGDDGIVEVIENKAKAEKENEANSPEPAEAEPEEPANFEETSGDVESGEENEI